SYAVTKSCAGSDVGATRTCCKKKGDKYVINGSKVINTSCGLPMVVLQTGNKYESTCVRYTAITFEDVQIPKSQMIGGPGEGFKIAMKTFDTTRLLVAAIATGLEAHCLDETCKYALERETFGIQISNN
uniref:Acyl-CoA dehydrogenase/oxidase C-terminal domain-containing protein n=1 Tax=Wuchereria bancrofti TaxID=6293 RepID=A0AAF5Q7H5_WUCBA